MFISIIHFLKLSQRRDILTAVDGDDSKWLMLGLNVESAALNQSWKVDEFKTSLSGTTLHTFTGAFLKLAKQIPWIKRWKSRRKNALIDLQVGGGWGDRTGSEYIQDSDENVMF